MPLSSTPLWGAGSFAVDPKPATSPRANLVARPVSAPIGNLGSPIQARQEAKPEPSPSKRWSAKLVCRHSSANFAAAAAMPLGHLAEHRSEYVSRLSSLVAEKTELNWPAQTSIMENMCEKVQKEMSAAGLRDVRLLRTQDAPPYVYGSWLEAGPEAITVLLYAHYDVQAAGDVEAWDTPPFNPTVRNGRLYGRGTCNNKAAITIHLAALEACIKTQTLPVNVKVLVEGEESAGSPHLTQLFAEQEELLRSDVALLMNTANVDTGKPALTYSLRGLAECTVEVKTLNAPVHSGNAGPVVDPLISLSKLIAGLTKPDGTVVVPGFYNDCRKITMAEHERIKSLGFSEERMRTELGIVSGGQLKGESQFPPLERIWCRPALSVLGIDAPTALEAPNHIQALARARISCRLAPHQSSTQILGSLRKYLERNAPEGCRVTVVDGKCIEPWVCEPEGPVFEACEKGLAQGYEKAPAIIGCGGSMPVFNAFAQFLPPWGVVMGIGLGDHDANPQSANESVDLEDLYRSMLAEVHMLLQLANIHTFTL